MAGLSGSLSANAAGEPAIVRHGHPIAHDVDPGDQEKATSLLDESLAISSDLGMRPLMERVLSRRDILKA